MAASSPHDHSNPLYQPEPGRIRILRFANEHGQNSVKVTSGTVAIRNIDWECVSTGKMEGDKLVAPLNRERERPEMPAIPFCSQLHDQGLSNSPLKSLYTSPGTGDPGGKMTEVSCTLPCLRLLNMHWNDLFRSFGRILLKRRSFSSKNNMEKDIRAGKFDRVRRQL